MATSTTTKKSSTTTGPISLPPQTTPYSYPAAGHPCTLSVYCPMLSFGDWPAWSTNGARKASPVYSSQHCLAVHTTGVEGTRVGYETRCFPESYFDLFPNEWGELNSYGSGTNEGDSSTLAYPGDVCMSGWTTACTTTIIDDSTSYPQAWCCPESGWSCATNKGSADMAAPERLCKSLLSDSTQLWMTWDPAYTLSGNELYTWYYDVDSVPPSAAASVYRKVFPLQLTAAISSTTNGAGSTQAMTSSGAQGNIDSSESPVPSAAAKRLSKRHIIGISVSASSFALCLVFAAVLLFIRLRKKARQQNQGNFMRGGQCNVIPKAELDARETEYRPPLTELDAVPASLTGTTFSDPKLGKDSRVPTPGKTKYLRCMDEKRGN